ncbi:MAG: type IV secretory system conjugative DNA transfer family protein [Firmicutes bacterium]|nr:type IV secretory system conjugative DNA transfer family protein [[Eubacterium] siraeum]MCM1489114.1 type IV secretory system conjugative DNA transfer family protein [Bacillota bacterium]
MKADRRIFGQGAVFSSDCLQTGLNNNAIICGGSGCGKTMSISEPLLLNTVQTSLIVTVTKRRLIDKYVPLFVRRGYNAEVIDFVHPEESTKVFDPLSYAKDEADVIFLASSIVKSRPKHSSSNKDEYWNNAAISLLTAEIGLSLWKFGSQSMPTVLSLNNGLRIYEKGEGIETTWDPLFDEMEKEMGSDHYAVRCWHTFKDLPRTTAGCVYSTLNSILDTLFTASLREMMMKDNYLCFEEIANKKTVLFVYTSAVNPSLNCFANMFYSLAVKELFEYGEQLPEGRLPIPVHLLCDDFATGSPILNFPEYISIFREKGLSATLLVQSESQIEKMYEKENAVTIINNCDTYVYMGGMDIHTAENVSKRLNAPLEDVLYMPVGRVAVFRRGQKPMITDRYKIEENPLYKRITESYETNKRKKSHLS